MNTKNNITAIKIGDNQILTSSDIGLLSGDLDESNYVNRDFEIKGDFEIEGVI